MTLSPKTSKSRETKKRGIRILSRIRNLVTNLSEKMTIITRLMKGVIAYNRYDLPISYTQIQYKLKVLISQVGSKHS